MMVELSHPARILCAILRLDEASYVDAALDRICDACNTQMGSTHPLFGCKKAKM